MEIPELAQYEFIKPIAKGAYGSVSLFRHLQSAQLVAIKETQYDESFLREVSVAEALSGKANEYVLKILFSFHNEDKTKGYIGYEYIPGGDLNSKECSNLSLPDTIRILINICKGLSFLHENRIVHGDLKLENIICIDPNTVKIADFGLSNVMRDGNTCINGHFGSPKYVSVETVSDNIVCFSSDIWSLGVLIFVLDQDYYPFQGRTREEIFDRIENFEYEYPEREMLVDYDRIFCEVEKRITLKELENELVEKLMFFV